MPDVDLFQLLDASGKMLVLFLKLQHRPEDVPPILGVSRLFVVRVEPQEFIKLL